MFVRKALRAFTLSIACSLILSHIPQVLAGGLIGDIVNKVIPGAGTALDDAHREVKNAIPPYKAIEESATHIVNESLVQTNAPILQHLIIQSRDDALRNGVQPIPHNIRQNLEGFIPNNVLDAARFRVKGGGDLTLQVNSIRYGEARAITLDHVIVFANGNDAQFNPTLWAHELTHVRQYLDWGIKDFAIRYLRSYQSVEGEAYEAETRYVAWSGIKNSQQWASANTPITEAIVNRPVASLGPSTTSNMCGTAIGTCVVNGSAPAGTPCWCNTPMGAATGSLIPTQTTGFAQQAHPPGGFPSNYGMQICGCWGPNPAALVPEPQCASGQVRINVCAGQCAPGHPPYAYVCR